MSMWGSEDVQNAYANYNRKKKDKAGWLDPLLTAGGAIAGSLLMPGVGTWQGASLGAGMGHAAGSVGHSLANGQVDPMQIGQAALTIGQGYQAGQGSTPQTSISPASNGTQPTLPDPYSQDNAQILQTFMQNPQHPMFQRYGSQPQGFALGGLVPPPSQMDQLLQMLQNRSGSPTGPNMGVQPSPAPQSVPGASLDVLGAIPGQVNTLLGPEPSVPTPQPLQQAQHPTLEALSALLPQIMAAMPRPANPKNNKAIGAWLPAAGLALSAPAAIAQSRRASVNAPIQAGNDARRIQYEADKKAYEAQRGTLTNTLAANATKPFADKATDAALSLDMAKRLGHPEWAGLTESQVRLKMQGMPDKPKVDGPPSPKDRAGLANMILDNVRQDPDIKNFVTVRDNYSRISRMAQNGTGVGDMSLIFAYMKVLDPTSVVRESEYKNAADAIGKIPQLGNIPANWMSGSKLTAAGRAGFVRAAQQLYEQQRRAYRAAIEMHKGFATEYGIDPRLVIRNYEALDAEIPAPESGGAQQPIYVPTAGSRYR